MDFEEARNIAIKYLRCDDDMETDSQILLEVADILNTCNCKYDFTDGTGFCQECGRKEK